MEASVEVSMEFFTKASVEATSTEAFVEARDGTYFPRKWKLPRKLPWKLPSSMGTHGSFRHVETFMEAWASTEASRTLKLPWKLPWNLLLWTSRKLPWKLLARQWKHVKAIKNIFPLRHLNGSFNVFHGTRGSVYWNVHGVPPKCNNRAGDRKTFMYLTLTYFSVVCFDRIEL